MIGHGPVPLKRHHFQGENSCVLQTKGGSKYHAERRNRLQQIIPKLREVRVGRDKTVTESVKKIGVTEQTYSR